ncbi:MAG: biotin--[acetyl-CoA-carboxylase] ligase [Thermoguttaceae bacterium]|jgi:BirA family biotin operon repressor/biotin-[acetyl-CoA-carboxylase] ligase|nr:biotin--[acetyl-CoA-carboxylase] ligase [Thermoguttaceae bacterium]
MVTPQLDLDRLVAESFLAAAEHYALIHSTNDRAKEAAAAPAELPLLIVADSQTAGRGRGANRWWTGRGSLAVSLLADPARWCVDMRRDAADLSLAAAQAVARTVNARLPEELPAEVHPPNDVYVGQRKLAGILIEGLGDGLLVVGIGLNTNNTLADAPPELLRTATTLRELLERPVDPTELLIDLLAHLDAALFLVGSARMSKWSG